MQTPTLLSWLSYYFDSRKQLLREALQVADARMDQAMADHAGELDSYADCLRRILMGYVQHCASHPAEVIAAQAIRESTTRETQEAREIEDGGGAPELIDFLVEGQEHGEFRQFDPVVFTDALFAAMRDVPRQLRERSAEERAALTEQFASIFVHAAVDHRGCAEEAATHSAQKGGAS